MNSEKIARFSEHLIEYSSIGCFVSNKTDDEISELINNIYPLGNNRFWIVKICSESYLSSGWAEFVFSLSGTVTDKSRAIFI